MGILTSPKASEPFHIARAIASASLRKSVQNPSQPSARQASHPSAKAELAAPELPLGGITGSEGAVESKIGRRGEIGRRERLRISWPQAVGVRVPPPPAF